MSVFGRASAKLPLPPAANSEQLAVSARDEQHVPAALRTRVVRSHIGHCDERHRLRKEILRGGQRRLRAEPRRADQASVVAVADHGEGAVGRKHDTDAVAAGDGNRHGQLHHFADGARPGLLVPAHPGSGDVAVAALAAWDPHALLRVQRLAGEQQPRVAFASHGRHR